jgi:hypothetical protein
VTASDPRRDNRARVWSGQASSLFGLSGDTVAFWDELDERHAQHRRHLVYLGIISTVLVVAGIVIHDAFSYFLTFPGMLAAVEWFMLRRTRSTSKIPDYRPAPTVEIDLEPGRIRTDTPRTGP